MTAATKTVLITGAAQGLGLTAAALLSQREYRVILLDIQSVEAQVLKLMTTHPQAVMMGNSATPAALPVVALPRRPRGL